MNKNSNKYTPEQMKYIMENLEEELNFFGYTNVDNNPYAFFDYKEEAKSENTAKYNGYVSFNSEMEEYWITQKNGQFESVDFQANLPGSGISMFKEKKIYKYLPVCDRSTIKEGKSSD